MGSIFINANNSIKTTQFKYYSNLKIFIYFDAIFTYICPLLSDLSVSLISIFFSYFCIKHKKINYFNKLLF